MRIDRQMIERRAEAGAQDDRPAAAGAAHHRPGAGRLRDPARGALLHRLPERLRLAATRSAALEGTGISVPALEGYADRLWDYWERNLDPDLFKDRSLRGAIEGKVVVITGASSGIGQARRAAGRRGRRDRGAGRALRGQAGGGRRRRSRRRAARRTCTRPTSPTSTTATGWSRRSSPSTAAWTSSSTTPAARSGARSSNSYDRFHDFQRTMQLNYFGALKLILGFLPGMRERKSGHIINVSSIGAQTNTPRFSAYVASKSALDAFSRSIASEIVDDDVHITTVYMPLVRTPMIAPTGIYDAFPTASPDEAADMITRAMIYRPKKIATRLGTFGEVLYALAPKSVDVILNTAFKLFPESAAAKGEKREGRGGLDRGRRVRAPDAGRALVVGSPQSAVRRRKHLGLGVRGRAALAARSCGAAAAGIRGASRVRRRRRRGARVRSRTSSCRAPRLEPPAVAGRDLLDRRRTTARRTPTARRTATWCAPSAAASTTRRTWSRSRATRREVAAVLDWCGERGAAAIPYGGGTSVVGGVEAAVGDGYAGAVTIDLRRLDRVLEVDRDVARGADPGRRDRARRSRTSCASTA